MKVFSHHYTQQKKVFHACFSFVLVCQNKIDLQDRYKWFTLFLPLFNCREMCSYQRTKHKHMRELADPGGARDVLTLYRSIFFYFHAVFWQFCIPLWGWRTPIWEILDLPLACMVFFIQISISFTDVSEFVYHFLPFFL